MTTNTETTRMPAFELRHRLELSIEFAGTDRVALAAYLGVSRQTIDNYCAGRTEPKLSTLRDWALATGVPVTWLLTGQIDRADTDAVNAGYPRDLNHTTNPHGYEQLELVA